MDHCESDHPNIDMLRQFVTGRLPTDETDFLERHLLNCDECNRILENFSGTNFLARLRSAHDAGDSLQTLQDLSTAPDTAQRTPETLPGYEIVRELGRGGMGVVYLAKQIRLKRLVALKMILHGGHAGANLVSRFRTEAEAVARIRHPGIIQIHEVGEHNGLPWFSLEYCSGGNLSMRLAESPLTPVGVAELVEKLARAVAAAHAKGVIHRDLKPANVLLDADGEPKVTDFGLAKLLDAESGTRTGNVMGSPSWMAPEQAAGDARKVGPTADVYALGAILYECLTGRPPFRGATALETIDQIRRLEPVPPRQLNPRVPRDLETICLKCLEKEPDRRYSGAEALADDLARFLSGMPVSVRAVGAFERTVRWASRKPTLAAAYGLTAVVGVLAIVAIVVGSLWRKAESAKAVAEQTSKHAESAYAQEQAAKGKVEELLRIESGLKGDLQESLTAETAAKNREAQLRRRLAAVEYGQRMQVADQELRENNITGTLTLLAEADEDFRGWEWRYLHRRCNADLVRLIGHQGPVASVCFSADGARILTGSWDRTARIWDAWTGVELRVFTGHTGWIWSARWNPDETRVVTGCGDTTARVWDSVTGKSLRTVTRSGCVNSVAFSPDGSRVLAAGWDGMARIWDADTGVERVVLEGHDGIVMRAVWSPDGSQVATSGFDGTLRLWNSITGKQTWLIRADERRAIGVAWSPDGTRLACGGLDGITRIWDAKSGKELLALRGHAGGVVGVGFSPDGTCLATAGGDRTARVWDAKTGLELLVLRGHTDSLEAVAWSPDGTRIATGGVDGIARVWDVRPEASGSPRKVHDTGIMAASVDDTLVVVRNEGTTATVRDARNSREVAVLAGHQREVLSAAFCPDGTRVATASWDGTARVWDVTTGVAVCTFRGHTPVAGPMPNHIVWAPSYSPDGRWVLTGGNDAMGRIWDSRTGTEITVLKGHVGTITATAWNWDGSRVATAGEDRTVRIWDVRTGAEVIALRGPIGSVSSIGFNPDGKRLVTGGRDMTARLWDTTSGVEVFKLRGHTSDVVSVAFSPDGFRVVTRDANGAVRTWDARPPERPRPSLTVAPVPRLVR